MDVAYRLLSALWFGYQKLAHGEWLAGIALAWWGWIRHGHGQPDMAWYVLAVLVVVLGLIAGALDYAVFVSTEGPEAPSGTDLPAEALATGRLLGYFHPSLPIVIQKYHLGVPVRLHWASRERPPHLLVVEPPNAPFPIRPDTGANWSAWYPGTTVRQGTVYLGGRAYPGVALSFAGRRLVLACRETATPAAVAEALKLPEL